MRTGYVLHRALVFQSDNFLIYSPYLNLEGTKDALFYKFKILTISQNCSAVCINKSGHRDALLSERHKALHISRDSYPAGHRASNGEFHSLSQPDGRFDV